VELVKTMEVGAWDLF